MMFMYSVEVYYAENQVASLLIEARTPTMALRKALQEVTPAQRGSLYKVQVYRAG